jgi:hypothetical protein
MSHVTLEIHSGPNRRGTWGRKEEEYIADFIHLTRNALDEGEYRIFRYRFLLGADWRLCCRQLGVDKGNLFHAFYRIQQKAGRMFAEVEPYALFPVDEYLNSTPRRQPVQACDAPRRPIVTPIRPPLAVARPGDARKIA